VKTRLSARCVFSRAWKDAGQGIALVMGVEKEEALRESVGGCFALGLGLGLGVRRGFAPPSCVFVGIVEMLDEASDPASGVVAGEGQSVSATSFRLRFRTIWLDTVAACNFGIAGLVGEGLAWRAV
jgi:hypothetical protein